MRMEIIIEKGRLAITTGEGPHEARLLLSTVVDLRTAEQTAALVAKMVGVAIADEVATQTGGEG